MLPLLPRLRDLWARVPPGAQSALARAAPMLACLLVGTVLGARACAPPPQVIHEEGKERLVYRDREVAAKVTASAADATRVQTKVIDRVRTVTVAGTCEERTHVVIGSQEHAATATQAAQRVVIERTGTEERQVQRTVTTAQPAWRVGVLAGVEFRHLGDAQLLGPVAFGAEVQRRVLGPVWIGGWGLSSGTLGLSLSAEF